MRKYKTITISLPEDMVSHLDQKINEINMDTLEETNRSKYIRLLIRKDMNALNKPNQYYESLLQLGGYKR